MSPVTTHPAFRPYDWKTFSIETHAPLRAHHGDAPEAAELQEIVNHLKTLGITSDKGSVCAFFKRHRRRPAPMGMEMETPSARRFVSQMHSPGLPELTESSPPQSDFDLDALTSPPMEKTKSKKWTVLQPNP